MARVPGEHGEIALGCQTGKGRRTRIISLRAQGKIKPTGLFLVQPTIALPDCYLLVGYRAAALAINSGWASQKMPADQMEEKELSDPAAAANYIASLAGDLASI